MSVKAMSLVWDMECPAKVSKKDFLPTHKFILLAYADHADHAGGSIYPAVKTIARKTGFNERTIQRATRELEEMGLLIEDGTGPRGTNKWKMRGDSTPGVTLRQGDTSTESLGDTDSGDIPQVTQRHPNLKNRTKENESIYTIQMESLWAKIKTELKEQMPRASFETWIEQSQPVDFDGQSLTIQAHNSYAREWLTNRVTESAQKIGGIFVQFVSPQPEEA